MVTMNSMYTAPTTYSILWAILTNPLVISLLAVSILGFTVYYLLWEREQHPALALGRSLEWVEPFAMVPLILVLITSFPLSIYEYQSAQKENVTAKYSVESFGPMMVMGDGSLVAEYRDSRYPNSYEVKFVFDEATGEPNAEFVKFDGAYPIEYVRDKIIDEITK